MKGFHLCQVCDGHERLVYANGAATRRGKPAGWYHVKCLDADVQPAPYETTGDPRRHVHRDDVAFATRTSRVLTPAI